MNQHFNPLPPEEDLYDVSPAKAMEILRHAPLPQSESMVLAGELSWEVKSSGMSAFPSIITFLAELVGFVLTVNEVTKYFVVTQRHVLTVVETSRRGIQDVVAIPHEQIAHIDICRHKSGFWSLKAKDALSHIHLQLRDESQRRIMTDNHELADRLLTLSLASLSIREVPEVTSLGKASS